MNGILIARARNLIRAHVSPLRSVSVPLAAALLLFGFARGAQAVPGDEYWSGAFGQPGIEGQVITSTSWSGSVIVAGSLDFAGSTAIANIARWDGTSLSPMGAGFNGQVNSLAVVGGVLYAAGDFDSSGITPLPHIARWTGTAWAPVGTGAPDQPYGLQLVADGASLLLLGEFTTVGSPPVAAQAIARWNGGSWSSVGGFAGAIRLNTAARIGSTLYVGGANDGNGALHWYDGVSWTSTDRVDQEITTLAALGSTLYIHGDFASVDYGAVPADKIASFDGTNFADLGGVAFDSGIERIGVDSGMLIAVGDFTLPHWKCAYWDGFAWVSGPLGLASSGGVLRTFARVGSDLLLGGAFSNYFSFATSLIEGARNVVVYNGATLRPAQAGAGLATAFGGYAQDVGVYGNRLIATGEMFQLGNLYGARGIAAWDGSRWSPLGNGLDALFGNPSGQRLSTWNSKLIVSGYFSGASGVSSDNIIAWNGSNWQSLDGGFTGQGALTVDYAGTLIAATGYTNLGTAVGTGTPLGTVARWTGTQWQTIGTTVATNSLADFGLVVWNGKVVFGASFTSMNGVPANNVAQWDGTSWSALGDGFNGFVMSLGVFNGELYASGVFTHSGATPIPGQIARWTGSAWVPVGTGLHAVATILSVNANRLYASGGFSTAGGAPAHLIAAWNGTAWETMGSGIGAGPLGNNLRATGFTTWGDSLFVAGFFNTAGIKSSNGIAKWFKPVSTDVSPVTVRPGVKLRAAPNPAVSQVQLVFDLPASGRAEISIFDLSGRLVRALGQETFTAGTHRVMWDGNDRQGRRVAPGVYRARVLAFGESTNTRVVMLQ